MPISAQKNKIYESISMIHPNGDFMCHVSKKRANWYINKGLANWVNVDSFKLKFSPNGYGNKHIPYYSQKLVDRCVVCGDDTVGNLNKHHVVPYVFRSRFPLNYKESNHHDILVVCLKCHAAYETEANRFKEQLAKNYNISIVSKVPKEKLYNDKIISNRILLDKINNGLILNVPLSRIEVIKSIAAKDLIQFTINEEPHWANILLDRFTESNSLFDFIKLWRKHFLDTSNPKFLPKHWSIEHKN